jgi:lipopolysaccharide transport system ATP-binding protein
MENDTLIKVEGVSKKFCRSLKRSLWYGMQDIGREIRGQRHGGDGQLRQDEFWASKDISFELKRGECIGLIGHNGAGKTTLLRILNGLIKPDSGRVEMRGRVGALIALGAGFNPILTGRENIYINASVLGLSNREIGAKIDEIIDFADIGEFIDSPVQSYSSGMAVRLGFAIAAKTDPDILLLDEVLAVGDIAFQAKCFNTLAEFREKGTAFILVSHNMHQISRYADQVLYLKRGKISYIGASEKGIEKFLVDMNQSDSASESERTDWSRVYGSGKLAFTGARFLDGEGAEVTTIDVGEAVTLEIDYERRSPDVHRCVIEIIARDREDAVLHVRTVADLDQVKSLNGHGKIRMSAASIPVNTGRLDFFFCALHEDTAEVFDWKRNLRLFVRAEPTSTAKLSLPVKWDFL